MIFGPAEHGSASVLPHFCHLSKANVKALYSAGTKLFPNAAGFGPNFLHRQTPPRGCVSGLPCVTLFFHKKEAVARDAFDPTMLFSKEYVGYLAREVTKKLIAGKFIEVTAVPAVTERVNGALVEELSLEDRINDEVRVILEAYSDEMRNTGANYQEMFRKVKSELVRKYKAVL